MRPVLVGALGSELHEDTLRLLDEGSSLVRHEHNDIVYEQGSPPRGMYVVCHGCVLLEWRAPNGFVAAFRLATGHECFGHRSYCGNEPRSTIARSITSTLLLFLPGRTLEHAMGQDPEFTRTLARVLARDTGPKLSKVTRNGRVPVRMRLAYLLSDLIKRLQSSASEDGVRFSFPLKQKDLSNLLDVSQETVSRVLHDFQQEGVLRIEHNPRRLLITDRATLEAIAAQHADDH